MSQPKTPLPRVTQGPTFPPKVIAAATSVWHMVARELSAKGIPSLACPQHRIVVPGDAGGQHNPTLYVTETARGSELRAIVRVLHGIDTTNYSAVIKRHARGEGIANRLSERSLVRQEVLTTTARHYGQLEDLRVFSWRGETWAVAVTHDGRATTVRQALCRLEGSKITAIHIQDGVRQEKNWMPCVDGDRLRLVYSTDPLVVLDVLEDRGRLFTSPGARDIVQTTSDMRGGSQLVPWNDGWIAVVHQVHKPPRIPKSHNPLLSDFRPPLDTSEPAVIYVHRFARFNRQLTRVHFSAPFFFRHVGIEFCCGLLFHEGQFLASFGVDDKEAWIAEIDPTTIATLLGEAYAQDPDDERVALARAATEVARAGAGAGPETHQCTCSVCGRTLPPL